MGRHKYRKRENDIAQNGEGLFDVAKNLTKLHLVELLCSLGKHQGKARGLSTPKRGCMTT